MQDPVEFLVRSSAPGTEELRPTNESPVDNDRSPSDDRERPAAVGGSYRFSSRECAEKGWDSLILPSCPKKFKESGDQFCIMYGKSSSWPPGTRMSSFRTPAAFSAAAIASD